MDRGEATKDNTIDNAVGRAETVNQIAEHLGSIMRRHLDECTRCCPNCDHWQEGKELCGLYNQRPPARVIAFGCERYDDRVPF